MTKYRCIKTCVVSPSCIYEPGDKIRQSEYDTLSEAQHLNFVIDYDEEQDDLQFLQPKPEDQIPDQYFPDPPATDSDESFKGFDGGDMGGGGSESSW